MLADIHQFCADTECRLEDLSRVIDDWQEKVLGIFAVGTPWWLLSSYFCCFLSQLPEINFQQESFKVDSCIKQEK